LFYFYHDFIPESYNGEVNERTHKKSYKFGDISLHESFYAVKEY